MAKGVGHHTAEDVITPSFFLVCNNDRKIYLLGALRNIHRSYRYGSNGIVLKSGIFIQFSGGYVG